MELADWLVASDYGNLDRDNIIAIIENLSNKTSMTPQENSGFRGKLIRIHPLTMEQCHDMVNSELKPIVKNTPCCTIF